MKCEILHSKHVVMVSIPSTTVTIMCMWIVNVCASHTMSITDEHTDLKRDDPL